MSDIGSKIDRANKFRQRIDALLAGEYSDATRTALLVGYTDIILEHHEAILLLLEKRRVGSAFALVRVLIEAFFCVQWAIACASDKDVDRIATKQRFNFPETEKMVQAIDDELQTNGFFMVFKKNAWKALNSYTHTGLLQMSRRFTETRVEPRYSDAEITEVVNVITTAIILLARFFFVKVGRSAEADQAEIMMEEYASA